MVNGTAKGRAEGGEGKSEGEEVRVGKGKRRGNCVREREILGRGGVRGRDEGGGKGCDAKYVMLLSLLCKCRKKMVIVFLALHVVYICALYRIQ